MSRLNLKKMDRRDWFVFFIGIFMVVKIRIIGTFTLAEILLLLSYTGGRIFSFWKDRNVKILFTFAFLWLVGTIVANFINSSDTISFIKGTFFQLLFLFLFPPIYNLLIDKPERLLLFFVGMGISGIWAPEFAHTERAAEVWSTDVYRFYAYYGLVSAVAYYLYFKGHKNIAILIIEIASIVGLYHASRNVFLTTTVAAVLLVVLNKRRGGQNQRVAIFKKKILSYVLAGFIGIFFVVIFYETAASRGILGDAAYQKYMDQTSEGNVLEGGRAEFFMGVELIKMKPIVGWGSYSKDTWGFRWRYAMEHNRTYHERYADEYESLPGHSYIVGSWASSGIFGGLFWIYVLIMLFIIFKSGCLLYEPRLLGLIIFQLIALLWAIFFSPFGDRVPFLVFMITLMIIYRNYNRGLYKDRPFEIKKLYI